MLTEPQLELLTAAADGTLPTEREPAFRRLLAESAEAKRVYRQLKATSQKLAALPKHKAPPGLHKAIMARVADVKPVTVPSTKRLQLVVEQQNWVPYVTAASVFFFVLAGSFWFNAFYNRHVEVVAQQQSLPRVEPVVEGVEPVAVALANDRKYDLSPRPRKHEIRPVHDPVYVNNVPSNQPPELAPEPRAYTPDVVGSGVMTEMKPLLVAKPRLPVYGPMADLEREDVRKKVAEELARDPAFRLDLFTRDTQKAVDAFQAVAKAAGIAVHADAAAADKAKRKATSVVAYTESLGNEDLVKLVAHLATHDKSAFTQYLLTPAQSVEQKDLRDLLGYDPGLWKRPAPKGSGTPGKSVTAGTVDQVTAALNKVGAKQLVLLPYPGRLGGSSLAPVKAFTEQRGERKPGAIPVLIVIRPQPN